METTEFHKLRRAGFQVAAGAVEDSFARPAFGMQVGETSCYNDVTYKVVRLIYDTHLTYAVLAKE